MSNEDGTWDIECFKCEKSTKESQKYCDTAVEEWNKGNTWKPEAPIKIFKRQKCPRVLKKWKDITRCLRER